MEHYAHSATSPRHQWIGHNSDQREPFLKSPLPSRPLATRLEAILNPEPQRTDHLVSRQPDLFQTRQSHSSHISHCDPDIRSVNMASSLPSSRDSSGYETETKTINFFNLQVVDRKLRAYSDYTDPFLQTSAYDASELEDYAFPETTGSHEMELDVKIARPPTDLSFMPRNSIQLELQPQSLSYSTFHLHSGMDHSPVRPARRAYDAAKLPETRKARRWSDVEKERFRNRNTATQGLGSPISSGEISPQSSTPPAPAHYASASPARSPSSLHLRQPYRMNDAHYPCDSPQSLPPLSSPYFPSRTTTSSSSVSSFVVSQSHPVHVSSMTLPSTSTLPDSHPPSNITSIASLPEQDPFITCDFDRCGQRINMSETPLGVHLNEKHRPRNQDRNANVTCLWEECGQSVKWRNLRRHIMEYHLALLFKECSICEKTFSRSDALKRHERLYCPGRKNKLPRSTKSKAKLPFKPLTWRTTVDWKTGSRKPDSVGTSGSAGVMVMDEDRESE